MLTLQHVKLICELGEKALGKPVQPSTIKPVQFGEQTGWSTDQTTVIASLFVPKNRGLIVLRVETYVTNYTNGAGDFGMHEPPPPGQAYWIRAADGSTTPAQILTPTDADSHLVCDADQLVMVSGGNWANLVGVWTAPADGNTRAVRTLCYGYLVGAEVLDALGGQTSAVIAG